MHHRFIRSIAIRALVAATLLSSTFLAIKANAQTPDRTLLTYARFFIPQPASGSIQQAIGLLEKFQLKNALLIAAMEATPQAVWLTGNTPAQTASTVATTLRE